MSDAKDNRFYRESTPNTTPTEAIQLALEFFEQDMSTATAWAYNDERREEIVAGLRAALSETRGSIQGPDTPVVSYHDLREALDRSDDIIHALLASKPVRDAEEQLSRNQYLLLHSDPEATHG
jgi:hypothetical protein